MSNTISFDESFYLSQNPDVAAAISRGVFTSGAQHYQLNGRFEGRNPNAFFNTSFYLGQYPDVAKAGINPLTHFINFGSAEGRFANATEKGAIDLNNNGGADDFNNAKYLADYKDVADAVAAGTFKNGYQHFVQFGQFEARIGTLSNGTTITGPFSNTGTAPNAGTTFTLTAGADTVVGTANADVINASLVYASGGVTVDSTSTLSAADQISGGAGIDTLNVTVTGGNAGTTFAPATISGVEVLNIRNVSGNTNSLDASTIAGLTNVNADRSTSTVTVTNLASGASAGIIGNGTAANGAFNAGYATAATAATLNVSDGTTGGAVVLSGTGVTSTTVNSTGAANTLTSLELAASSTTATINAATNLTTGTLTATNLATLNVAGAATSVNVGALTANVRTVDASGLTAGGLTATLNAGITSFKGGQGNDVITTAALTSTTAGIINAGAGSDTLVVAAGADVDTAAEAALYTGFEVLRNAGTTDLDVSLLAGITSVEVTGADAGLTKLTAAQAANVKVLTSNATNTFALTTATGTADVLGLTLAPASAATVATPIDVTGATVTGFETINVVSSSGLKGGASGAGNDLAFAAAGDLTTINVSGEYDLTVNTANITKAVTINSTQTGTANLNVLGNVVKGSVINTTANADTITTSAAISGTTGDFATYNAGAGNDNITSTAAAINNTSAANGSIKIDGGAGTDKLTLTDAASLTLTDNNFQFLTGIEEISYTVANKAISITSGGFTNTNFATGGLKLTLGDSTNAQVNTVDLTTFTGAANVSLNASAATTQAQTIITGSGADTVTLLAAGTTTANHVINTGAGADTITVTIDGTTITTGNVTINAGAGKDTITIIGDSTANADTAVNTIVRVQEGHSTLADFDTINGAVVSATTGTKQAFQLDFDGNAQKNADVASTAVAGYTTAELTYSVSNGLLAFSGTSAAALTAAQKATIAQNVITAANSAVAYVDGNDSFVFHNGATTDSLVKLAGVQLLGIDSATTGYIDVA
ncbi:beta strand repeat-containing protein [Aureimonas ureilytica]|uniref:beta strand repeat-containing protein n=1 Tax=Aureimonas ureilytica TaxID=401562 RepID=UPI00035DD719|nr:hypothetical protein [Aureimonas ureilytica]